MAKRRTVEDQLSELSRLRGMGAGLLKTELPRYLASPTSFVVAKAAELAREAKVEGLEKELIEAFSRFQERPAEIDKGCTALTAIARAMVELECHSEQAARALLWGVQHVQKEGGFAARIAQKRQGDDAAVELRGLSAVGLVQMRHRGVMELLVEMLARDDEPAGRGMAARAIAYAGKPESSLLLRLKALMGDDQVIMAECFMGIAQLEREEGIEFLRGFLDDPIHPEYLPDAAMALGEMRNEKALEVLLDRWKGTLAEEKEDLLLPIVLSRRPRAVEFLLEVIESGDEQLARLAVEAMGIYRHDSAVRDRIKATVEKRAAPSILERFASVFGR